MIQNVENVLAIDQSTTYRGGGVRVGVLGGREMPEKEKVSPQILHCVKTHRHRHKHTQKQPLCTHTGVKFTARKDITRKPWYSHLSAGDLFSF